MITTTRPTIVQYGSESYYELRAAGWVELVPFADGDASNPMRIMTPPGYTEPAKPAPRRCFREMPRSERKHR